MITFRCRMNPAVDIFYMGQIFLKICFAPFGFQKGANMLNFSYVRYIYIQHLSSIPSNSVWPFWDGYMTLSKANRDLQLENKKITLNHLVYPIGSMYGIFTYIYHKDQPNVGKYTIHGSHGYVCLYISTPLVHEVMPCSPEPRPMIERSFGGCSLRRERALNSWPPGQVILWSTWWVEDRCFLMWHIQQNRWGYGDLKCHELSCWSILVFYFDLFNQVVTKLQCFIYIYFYKMLVSWDHHYIVCSLGYLKTAMLGRFYMFLVFIQEHHVHRLSVAFCSCHVTTENNGQRHPIPSSHPIPFFGMGQFGQ